MSGRFTKRGLIAILLCVVLVATMLPVVASAAKYSAPVMKKAVLSSNGIKITWKGSSGAAGYRVYRRTSTKAEWKAIADVTKKSYVDTNPVNGATNYYSVRALKANGRVNSDFSANSVYTQYFKKPKKVKAVAGEKSVTVTWKSVGGAPLYRVERKKGSGSWKTIGTTIATSYVDASISFGKTYSYRVRVVTKDNKAALSLASKAATVAFTKTAKISSLVNRNGHIHVEWPKIKGASQYRLFRKTEDGDWFTVSIQAGREYNDYDVLNNVNYTYYVRCLDAGGNYMGSYDAKGKSITYFVAPTMVDPITHANRSLLVRWEAVDGSSNYVIFRRIGAGSWERVGTSTTLSFNDSTAPSGTYCEYTVACADASGNIVSGYGTSVVGATSYMDEPLLTGIANGIGSITISWQQVDLAPQYIVYRYIGDKIPKLTDWKKIATVAGTTYTDTDTIQNNRTYWYSVAVRDITDTTDLSELNENALTIVYYTPPTLVSVTNEVDGAMVKWNKVDGASSYKIYRWTGNGSWTQIGTAAKDNNTYTDFGVQSTGHYWYSVASVAKNDSAYRTELTGAMDTIFYGSPVAAIANKDGYVSVGWDTVDGIGTYQIMSSNKKWDDGTVLYTGADRSYVLNSPTSGTMYYFKVCSINGGIRVSGWRTLKTMYLERPRITAKSSPETKKVKLNWSKVEGASYYLIEIADSNSDNWQLIYSTKTDGKVTEKTFSVPYTNVTKRFRITAVGGDNGEYTSVVSKVESLAIK
jgi:fibronectin type 3 domain-containing protein